MIDHTARSKEDAVSLSLSNSLYHRGRFPTPALRNPSTARRDEDRYVGLESRVKCAEQTIVSHHTIVGKSIILQLEKKREK